MIVRRTIDVEFETRCGDVTASAIVASFVAAIDGRLTSEQIIGRVEEGASVRVSRPDAEEVAA